MVMFLSQQLEDTTYQTAHDTCRALAEQFPFVKRSADGFQPTTSGAVKEILETYYFPRFNLSPQDFQLMHVSMGKSSTLLFLKNHIHVFVQRTSLIAVHILILQVESNPGDFIDNFINKYHITFHHAKSGQDCEVEIHENVSVLLWLHIDI